MNMQVLDFFKEAIYRLQSKSPRFFFILQVFAAFLTFAGYFPSILQVWFKVEVPGHVISLCENVAKYSLGFFIGVKLPSKINVVAQTEDGKAIKVTDEKKLPFTAKAEAQKVDEAVPPPPVESVPEVKDDQGN